MKKLFVMLSCLILYFVSYQVMNTADGKQGFGRSIVELKSGIKSDKDVAAIEKMLMDELKVNKGMDCRVCLLYFCKM